MIYLGNKGIDSFYLGNNKLNKIYLGDKLVWQSEKIPVIRLFKFDVEGFGWDEADWYNCFEKSSGLVVNQWSLLPYYYNTFADIASMDNLTWEYLNSIKWEELQGKQWNVAVLKLSENSNYSTWQEVAENKLKVMVK